MAIYGKATFKLIQTQDSPFFLIRVAFMGTAKVKPWTLPPLLLPKKVISG